jgi:hypothetical protein
VRERDHLTRTLGTLASTENVWMWAALCALYPLPVPEALAPGAATPPRAANITAIAGPADGAVGHDAGIQFKPQTRARLIERLRRTLGDGDGGLPRAMQQALAFWRAETIADDADWAQDTSGRGLHRRLVVALLDLWTDPERAARELSALWKSPQMPAIREELGRMRPAGKQSGAPEPGSFHVPLDPASLTPKARARLHAAGMGGLGTPEVGGSRRWPWWLRGVILLAVLMFVAGATLLAIAALQQRTLANADDIGQWALARERDAVAPPGSLTWLHDPDGASDTPDERLLAHIAGEWRDVGTWPIAEDLELVTESLEVTCPAAVGGLRRCMAKDAPEAVPARRIAILDAGPDSVDAVKFADSLLDRGLVDAAWIGEWPPWLADRTVRALADRRGLEVWVFTIDPDFMPVPMGTEQVRGSTYPSIAGGSTGKIVAADFCGNAVCAVTEAGGDAWFLRGGRGGTTITQLSADERIVATLFTPERVRVVAVAPDGQARVRDATTGSVLVELQGSEGGIVAAAFSPDGNFVVTATADKTARIERIDGATPPVILEGHEGAISSAVFSPDGRRVVTVSADRTARVWQADGTGEPVILTGAYGRALRCGVEPGRPAYRHHLAGRHGAGEPGRRDHGARSCFRQVRAASTPWR